MLEQHRKFTYHHALSRSIWDAVLTAARRRAPHPNFASNRGGRFELSKAARL
jgi:hypothetical protein